jgi:acyl-coenzyme A thioesterase PaaI-like protein
VVSRTEGRLSAVDARTHLAIDAELVGSAIELEPGRAVVECTTVTRMVADGRGLVHGGFVFGVADYAAMLAVNDPNVVLGASEVTFLKAVALGDVLRATAVVEVESGRKRAVRVSVACNEMVVLEGSFTCFVLQHHVFDRP